MYPKEMNEKLGKLQDLLEDQAKLQNEIRTKKMFIQEDLKNLSKMRLRTYQNTKQINALVKDLGMNPLQDIEEEEGKATISISELRYENVQ